MEHLRFGLPGRTPENADCYRDRPLFALGARPGTPSEAPGCLLAPKTLSRQASGTQDALPASPLEPKTRLGGTLQSLTVTRIGHFSPRELSRQAPWSPRRASDQALRAQDVPFDAPSEVQDPLWMSKTLSRQVSWHPRLPENDVTPFMIEVRGQINRHFFPDQICVATRPTSHRRCLSTGSR